MKRNPWSAGTSEVALVEIGISPTLARYERQETMKRIVILAFAVFESGAGTAVSSTLPYPLRNGHIDVARNDINMIGLNT